MKICFMVTGLLRNFHKSLYIFLKELSTLIDIDIYIYTTKDSFDSKFSIESNRTLMSNIINEDFCKLFVVDSTQIEGIQMFSQREQNIFYQWKKIYQCFKSISQNTYDYIIRVRPDISILASPMDFLKMLSSIDTTKLFIPNGNDLFTAKIKLDVQSINDQFAIGNYSNMKKYSEFYEYLWKCIPTTESLMSEVLLNKYLELNQIPIQRFHLPYNLYLSDCSVIAICGNSGAGKTTILNSIQKVFPFDSNLLLETDRYHKWERNSAEWKQHTHLNPHANNLEKMSNDTYLLKMGEAVEMIDYDHTTGKFTAPIKVESKNFIFLCGLHTLYGDSLRKHLDFKIYIDTEESLNNYWKIRRDMQKRGHSLETIVKNIETRKIDYQQYILPQRKYADSILGIAYKSKVPDYNLDINSELLEYTLEIKIELASKLSKLLSYFSEKQSAFEDSIKYYLYTTIPKEAILNYAKRESIFIDNPENIEANYLGILQLCIILVLFK